ncbi:WXG100 family type VII secretion target [Nocardia salmonicida]|uniref:WXG100 family type VII secretion target n=1 Tax=Nocardia salmonicida TaxID=53431 RepID=UPI0007A3DBA3|nr:WXG100 family type VII secretion target [Nocardia salmonicida]
MAEFTVDLDQLDNLVTRLVGLAGFVGDHLDDIDDKVAGLLGTGWESVAAEAYQAAHQQWVAGARDFADGIRTMSDAAKAAHGHYGTAQSANSRMFRGS